MDQADDSLLQAGRSGFSFTKTTNRKISYTDGSVPKDQSAWGYTVKQGVTIIHEDSAAIHSLYLDHCN